MQQAAWGAVFHFQINTKHPCFPQELSCLPCCSFWVTGAPPGFVLSSSSAKQPARSWQELATRAAVPQQAVSSSEITILEARMD